jgi:NAD(P)-dependent dehydrogenase (short-subunit alcohol dehydrogenase family)
MKTVLITGAGGGIGEVTAAVFAQRGYRVAVADIDRDAAERSAGAIRQQGGTASAYAANIGIAAEVERLFSEVLADFGRIDVAFNNAGVSGGRKALMDLEEAEFDHCIQTNLKGTWLCMKQEIRHMLEQGGGVIVNNSSVIGMQAGVGAAYCASKHGIVGLTRSASLVYASKGVRINAVCPGLIESGLGQKLITRLGDDAKHLYATIPAGRAGRADEVAKAVVWLASDDASFVHGHMLAVDGGYLSH